MGLQSENVVKSGYLSDKNGKHVIRKASVWCFISENIMGWQKSIHNRGEACKTKKGFADIKPGNLWLKVHTVAEQ